MDRYAQENFPEAVRVVERLREKGHEAYFAGGYFRDRFLARRPADVDVATAARPDQVRALFKRTIPVGEQFGIIIVQQGGARVEVATFRVDEGYEDGRRPTSVRFTSAEADAQRRDFTINGIFWDPVDEKALDFVRGKEDLEAGVVRAIGEPDARFDEDKLRILRAPRFAAKLGFRLDAKTAEAARRRAGEVAVVSAERIREELDKMLKDANRAHAARLLAELGLDRVVLREVDASAFALGEKVLAALPPDAPRTVAWAALLAGAGESAALALLKRLRSSNADQEAIAALVRDRRTVRSLDGIRLADRKRLLLRQDALSLIELARAEAKATGGDFSGIERALSLQREFREEKGPAALSSPPLLKGNDLKELGLKPGPRFKELLDFAENARLEGRASDRESLVALIRAEKPELFEAPR